MLRKPASDKSKGGGGRPRKFAEPSRPVTLTLPESTLAELHQIDADRSCAIVKLAKRAVGSAGQQSRPLVEIVEMGAQTGVIIVGHCKALGQIPFLHLVEVASGRFLLALERGNDFKALELALNDVLAELADGDSDRQLLIDLLGQMRRLRKDEMASPAEILLVRMNGQHA